MEKLFGSRVRTDVLVALARFGTSYVSELARILSLRPTEVLRAVASLERSGAVVSRLLGKVRTVELSPRFPERRELLELLLRLGERPNYASRWTRVRRRPRAIGKAL